MLATFAQSETIVGMAQDFVGSNNINLWDTEYGEGTKGTKQKSQVRKCPKVGASASEADSTRPVWHTPAGWQGWL